MIQHTGSDNHHEIRDAIRSGETDIAKLETAAISAF